MKHNKIHTAKGLFLFLLTVAILLSSAGIYCVVEKPTKEITAKAKPAQDQKGEKVSASKGFEAVVVSIITPDFIKEVFFSSFNFSPILEKITITPNKPIVSEKYFRTLFTHFISPNAP